MRIYLAGSIPKGDEEAKKSDNWRKRYKEVLATFLDAEFIEPHHRALDEGDFLAVVGQDCRYIKDSTLIIINAEGRIGAGTAQEFVIAKYFHKPVICVLPKDTHHRRSNLVFHGKNIADWIHPFIFVFSDFIVESVNEIDEIKEKILSTPPKDISVIHDAIRHIDAIEREWPHRAH